MQSFVFIHESLFYITSTSRRKRTAWCYYNNKRTETLNVVLLDILLFHNGIYMHQKQCGYNLIPSSCRILYRQLIQYCKHNSVYYILIVYKGITLCTASVVCDLLYADEQCSNPFGKKARHFVHTYAIVRSVSRIVWSPAPRVYLH